MLLSSLSSPIFADRRPSGWQIMAQVGENLSRERDRANEETFKLFKTNYSLYYRFHGKDNPTEIAVKSITISGRCRFKIAVPK